MEYGLTRDKLDNEFSINLSQHNEETDAQLINKKLKKGCATSTNSQFYGKLFYSNKHDIILFYEITELADKCNHTVLHSAVCLAINDYLTENYQVISKAHIIMD